ncbi:hypothetical protein PFLUV_G00054030 [Perca fluviatilis]|uniref:Uncharacterized protein n=1 Tax=Perca fluviatilis TaxID=8168 RepID=A0A6A5FCD0_PERFL|nr:hypothetical protein PFLUV_G00054030 [Perca fluviatilis]
MTETQRDHRRSLALSLRPLTSVTYRRYVVSVETTAGVQLTAMMELCLVDVRELQQQAASSSSRSAAAAHTARRGDDEEEALNVSSASGCSLIKYRFSLVGGHGVAAPGVLLSLRVLQCLLSLKEAQS